MFVEDHLDKFGLEKAINLSLAWANMHFLGCSYPPHTQTLVSDYPLPEQDVLVENRRKRERADRKRRERGKEDKNGTATAPKRQQRNHSESSEHDERDGVHDSSGEEVHPSFEQVSLQVDALISAIRKQHEKKAEKASKRKSAGIPREIVKMLHTMCMCNKCFCCDTSPSSQVNSIMQRYIARHTDSSFKYSFNFVEDGGTALCKFVINGELVATGENENRKNAKHVASENFLLQVKEYYRLQGKPCCPHM